MKVLVADDDIVSRRLIESSVSRWGFEAIAASDGLEAAKILHGPDPPKLAILDWMMPGLDGAELCRQVRQKKQDGYTYIILLTCKQTQEDVIEGLEAGADDYVSKPFDPQELQVRLRNGKRILHLLDQLISARETLRDLAARDPLTGLWNHNSIIDLLESEIARSRRQGSYVGVVLVDIDHFKSINDSHGHLVGDQVLCQLAQVMTSLMRPYDAVGRLGGEEFVIVLPGCDRLNAVSHAERLRGEIDQLLIELPHDSFRFTASFGVTVVDAGSQCNARMAIRAADFAMYAAKRGGRDRVEYSDESLEPLASLGVQ